MKNVYVLSIGLWLRNIFRSQWLPLVVIAITYLSLAGSAALRETPTADEYQEMPPGLVYWTQGGFSLDPKNPPIAKMWATWPLLVFGHVTVPDYKPTSYETDPLTYARAFEIANSNGYLQTFTVPRFMIIFLTLLLGVLIYLTVLDFASPEIAWVVTTAFLFSPTILAHGHLATCDMGCALTIFATWFVYRKTKTALGAGALFGLALATKLTALLALPWMVMWILVQSRTKKQKVYDIVGFFVLALASICLCYGFHDLGESWKALHLHSRKLQNLPVPGSLRILLPAAFVQGFDDKLSDIEAKNYLSYFLGTWSNEGSALYYLLAFSVKETVGTVLAVIAGFYFAMRNRTKWRETAIFVLPIFIFLIPLSFVNDQQLGIRYLLPAYPFLFITIGFALKSIPKPRLISTVLLLSWFTSAFLASENSLGYLNEVALASVQGNDLRLLADSNLDWGADLYRVPRIVSEELASQKPELASQPIGLMYWGETSPKDYGIDYYLPSREGLRPGLVIISANFVLGYDYFTPTPEGTFTWVQTASWAWMKDLTFKRRVGSLFVFTCK